MLINTIKKTEHEIENLQNLIITSLLEDKKVKNLQDEQLPKDFKYIGCTDEVLIKEEFDKYYHCNRLMSLNV